MLRKAKTPANSAMRARPRHIQNNMHSQKSNFTSKQEITQQTQKVHQSIMESQQSSGNKNKHLNHDMPILSDHTSSFLNNKW